MLMKPGKPRNLKINNRNLILDLLRKHDSMSVISMTEKSRLSKTTIMKILDYFVTTGTIKIAGKGLSTAEGGKRPGLYCLNDTFIHEVGMHIFPGGISAVTINAQGKIVSSLCVPLNENEEKDSVISKAITLYNDMIKQSKVHKKIVDGLAIAFSGIVDSYSGTIRYLPRFPSWGENVPIVKLLQKTGLPSKIVIDNESRFMVTAEMIFGAATGCKNIISVFIDHGLVAGIVTDGKIRRGMHHLEGEIGHMIVNPYSNEQCVCGGRGCLEAMLMQKRIMALIHQGFSEYSDSLIFKNNLQPQIENVFTAFEAGDVFARKLSDEIIKWLAICFSNLIVTHDPEIIILQGIYAKAGPLFLETLINKTNSLVLPRINKQVKIVFSTLEHDAAARGAAFHILEEYFKGEK